MTRGLMEVINISPGQEIYVEDYRMQDYGLEWNIQNELDYRTEYLMTNRVVMEAISNPALWGLSGWTPSDSLEITQSGGSLICDVGLASIGGRRYIRTGSGAITPTGTTGDDTYWIRLKYDTSSNTHSFIGESTSSPPQADTATDKRVTLAQATKASGVWTGTPVDYRTSNTQLSPPATITGDAGSSPILTLTQTGTGHGLLVQGGDVSVGDATYDQQLLVYGNSTNGINIYDDSNSYSVQMIATGTSTMTLQNVGGGSATLAVANVAVTSGPTISSSGIDLNTDSITNGTWSGTKIAVAQGGTNISSYTVGDILYASGTTTLTKLGVGSATSVLVGGSTPSWDSTPILTSLTTSGSGTIIASSATVGGSVFNLGNITASGSISGVTSLTASGIISTTSYLKGNYVAVSTSPVTITNAVTLGSGTGISLEIHNENGDYVTINPSGSNGVTFIGSGTSAFDFTGNMITSDVKPRTANTELLGDASLYWYSMHANYIYYKPGNLNTFDHLDDLAILDSIRPKSKDDTSADLSGVPEEIVQKDGFMAAGAMEMLLVGGVNQLHKRVRDQDELIAVLMDEIADLKEKVNESNAS